MSIDSDSPSSKETGQLLSELELALARSDLVREIVHCCQRLHDLERILGPCRKSRMLRLKIEELRCRLKAAPGWTGEPAISRI